MFLHAVATYQCQHFALFPTVESLASRPCIQGHQLEIFHLSKKMLGYLSLQILEFDEVSTRFVLRFFYACQVF